VIGLPSTAASVTGDDSRRNVPVNGARGLVTDRRSVASSAVVVAVDHCVPNAGTVSPSASKPLLCSWLAASAAVSTVTDVISLTGTSRSFG
jgi:hypothetical protein